MVVYEKNFFSRALDRKFCLNLEIYFQNFRNIILQHKTEKIRFHFIFFIQHFSYIFCHICIDSIEIVILHIELYYLPDIYIYSSVEV